MYYSMARTGALPEWFAKVHPKYKTPINCVHAQFAVIVVGAVILTKWWGKENIWFVDGGMITFALGTIYILGSLSVINYYLREKRDQFNVLMHGVFPIATSIAMVDPLLQVAQPVPAGALQVGPDHGLRLGDRRMIVVALLAFLGKESWLQAAGRAADERPESPEELAHRPTF